MQSNSGHGDKAKRTKVSSFGLNDYMGTEMLYPIGTVLTRKDPKGDFMDEVHVIAGGSKLVVESRKEFTGAHELDVSVARNEYDAEIPESVRIERPSVVDPGLSPEQVFAGEARTERKADEAAGKQPKQRSYSGRKKEEVPTDES